MSFRFKLLATFIFRKIFKKYIKAESKLVQVAGCGSKEFFLKIIEIESFNFRISERKINSRDLSNY